MEKTPDGSLESTGAADNLPGSLPVPTPARPHPPTPPKPVLAPIDSDIYKRVLDVATQAGHGAAFRAMCMVLKAPPLLNCFSLVLKNVGYMLTVLPDEWEIEDCFVGWSEMVAWALKSPEVLDAVATTKLRSDSPGAGPDADQNTVELITGFGQVEYPIYATLCCHHELINSQKSQKNYARLQAHLLIARHRQLREQHQQSHVDLYETHTHPGDFANKKVRKPGTVAQEIRKMRADIYGPMLAFMCPELDQEAFSSYLLDLKEFPPSVILPQILKNIGYYCTFKTSARPDGKRVRRYHGDSIRSSGFIQYNDTRTGMNYWNDDLDDGGPRLSQQEFIRDHVADRNVDPAQNPNHPDELGDGNGFIGQGDSHETGTTPGKLASARSAVHRIEIDTDRMAWSATHLRPAEIAGTLLSHLRSVATAPGETITDEELENCALIAVSLETARPLAAAMEIRSASTEGNFLFVPAGRKGGTSQWCWSAIEPYYAKEVKYAPGSVVLRAFYLYYPVHPVADMLLRTWAKRHRKNSPKSRQLFEKPIEEYRSRLRIWLKELDGTGRLTASKIADLKWILLCRETGSDIAEACLTLGQHQRMAGVPLFYSLLSVSDTIELFQKATATLWNSPPDDGPAKSAKTSDEEEDYEVFYTGSRNCPNLTTVRRAIGITRKSAKKLAHLDLAATLPPNFVKMFNRAVLFLVWHQSYAFAARGIRMPYIPLSRICDSSGVTTLADKDRGTGYKTRLLWLTPALVDHMKQAEPLIERIRCLLQIESEFSPIFFLNAAHEPVTVQPKTIEKYSRKFFAFPSNTPRHFMRFEVRKHLSSEEVEMFMGHSIERREPWCKWSTLDYGPYLDKLCVCIPEILAKLGFERRTKTESAGH